MCKAALSHGRPVSRGEGVNGVRTHPPRSQNVRLIGSQDIFKSDKNNAVVVEF